MSSAVHAASSATGWSAVPADATTMIPSPFGTTGVAARTARRASGWYTNAGSNVASAAARSASRRVTSACLAACHETLGDGGDLRDGLPFPEDHLGHPRPELAVQIRLRVAELDERQVAERRDRPRHRLLAALHPQQELLEAAPIHRRER